MRRTVVVFLWLVATASVVYVANAAVELVDLQVFPGGSRIEVLSLPDASEPPLTGNRVATTSAAATTTVPPSTTAPEAVTATTASTTTTSPTTTSTTTSTTTTTTVPTTTTVGVLSGESPTEPAPTTTAAPAITPTTTPTTTLLPATATTTEPPPATTAAPSPTTTRPPTTTTTLPSAPRLVVSTLSFPEARVGESFRVELVAFGGTPPYIWSLVTGPLPAGIDLSTGGVLSGVPAATADISLVFGVTDAEGRVSTSPSLVFVTAPDRRSVVARGGTIFIDSAGDSVALFLASPADGYSAVIVEPGGFRVEVQFIPLQGDATSWVVCEVDDGVVCTTG